MLILSITLHPVPPPTSCSVLLPQGPRPDALVIEKTLDQGHSWQPTLYIASDCQASFPGVSTATPRSIEQTYCYTLPPAGPSHYRDQKVSRMLHSAVTPAVIKRAAVAQEVERVNW